MTKQKKIVNGKEVLLYVTQTDNFTQISVTYKGNIIYSVIDGLSDGYTEAVDNVMQFLLNTL